MSLLATYQPEAIGTPGFYGQSQGMMGTTPITTPSNGVDVPMDTPDQAQAYKAGGPVKKRNGMIAAHFNPQELRVLDVAQGRIRRDREGNKAYPGLESLIENMHFADGMHHHARAHRASGGHTHPAPISPRNGRFGDTEIALIGPHTRNMLDMYAGHRSANPYDGHPEYFDLSSIFGGLGNMFSGAGNSFLNGITSLGSSIMPVLQGLAPVAKSLLPMAGQLGGMALGSEFGMPQLGSQLGGMLGNLGGNALGSIMPEANQPAQGAYGNVQNGLNAAMNAYQGGGNMREAAARGVQGGLQGMTQPWAGPASAAAGAYGYGANGPQALGAGMQNYANGMNGPFGRAIYGAGQALNQGDGLRDAGRAAFQGAMGPDEGPVYGPQEQYG